MRSGYQARLWAGIGPECAGDGQMGLVMEWERGGGGIGRGAMCVLFARAPHSGPEPPPPSSARILPCPLCLSLELYAASA